MMRSIMITWCMVAMLMNGCARSSDQHQSIDIEQTLKEMQEGQITREGGMRKIFDAGRKEVEEKYRKGRISSEEYARRKVVILMDEAYEMLATSETEEHLDAVLKMSSKYDIQITKLFLYKNDGTVSNSNDQNEVGSRIDSIVDDIAVGSDGVHGVDGGKKGNFAMLRSLPNQKSCHRCHTGDLRILGGVYISIGKEELRKIQ